MSMRLVAASTKNANLEFVYNVEHSTPGKGGTVVEAPVSLVLRGDGLFTASLNTDNAEGRTANEALDNLERWLRRLADGIKERNSITIPF